VNTSSITHTRESIEVVEIKFKRNLDQTTTKVLREVLADFDVIVVITLPTITDGNDVD